MSSVCDKCFDEHSAFFRLFWPSEKQPQSLLGGSGAVLSGTGSLGHWLGMTLLPAAKVWPGQPARCRCILALLLLQLACRPTDWRPSCSQP